MTPTKTMKAVLFDFDYTLADSSVGVVDCINYALERMGEDPCDTQACCDTIGLALDQTYYRLTGKVDPLRAADFFRFFLERADEVMVASTRLYEGIHGMIHQLNQRNMACAIVSTKFRMRIEQILSRNHLADAFSVIIGGEDVKRHKPDPEGIQQALSRLAVHGREAVYVGDSVVDAKAAKRGRIPFIAVLSGRTPASEFVAFQPLSVIESVSALPDILTRLGYKECHPERH